MMSPDEALRREEIRRGERARALLEDETLAGAFAQLETQITAAWRNSPGDQPALREHCWHHLQALNEVRGMLEHAVLTGDMARLQLHHGPGAAGVPTDHDLS